MEPVKSHLPESPRHPGHQIPLALHIRFQPRSTIPVNVTDAPGILKMRRNRIGRQEPLSIPAEIPSPMGLRKPAALR